MSITYFQATALKAGVVTFKDRDFSVRYLSEFSALHFYQYSGELRIGDTLYRIQPGDVSFTPLAMPSWYNLYDTGTHHYIHVDLADSGGWPQLQAPLFFRSGVNQRQMKDRFEQVQQYLSVRDEHPLAANAADLIVKEILVRLILETEHAFPVQRDPVSKAATYLEQNLDTEIDIPEVADEVGISPNYLALKFRETFGITMKQFLLKKRMETAKFLLSSTDLTIGAIGNRVGIPDPQYFNKCFRKEEGISPSRYRKAN